MKNLITLLIMLFILPVNAISEEEFPELDDCALLIRTGHTTDAQSKLIQFRRKYPANPRALLYTARIEDDTDTALALYKEVERLSSGKNAVHPDLEVAAESVYERAEIFITQKKTDQAKELYSQVIELYPGTKASEDALYRLGAVNLSMNKTGEALKCFERYISTYPGGRNRAFAAIGEMECHYALGEWDKVVTSARAVLDETDEVSALTPRVLEATSEAWNKLGNSENAKWYSDRLLRDFPDSYPAYSAREENGILPQSVSGEEVNPPADSSGKKEKIPRNPTAGMSVKGNTAGKTFYSVQAAAFEQKENAYSLYKKIKSRGMDSRIDIRTIDGKHFYKVLVGRYSDIKQAEEQTRRVSDITGAKASVVEVE